MNGPLIFDEEGSFVVARALLGREPGASPAADATPCELDALNGSWYLQLVPQGPHVLSAIRGPMRIEAAPPRVRVSGDVYVRDLSGATPPINLLEPITERPLIIDGNWYPHLPEGEYAWYFRSTGATFENGRLLFQFTRHLWNALTQEFAATDTGFMDITCTTQPVNHPRLPGPTIGMTGTAVIGDTTLDVTATKTSPFYRGCHVEIDVMTNRSWPETAETCDGEVLSFVTIYRRSGFDCRTVIGQTDLAEDPSLTIPELQLALSGNRDPNTMGDTWRLWMLIGSSMGGTFGIMFDQQAPHREGVAGFFDVRLPDVEIIEPSMRGRKLGEAPSAFLRTLVHEAGHAFNLFHPKDDLHSVPKGTTIMNQTGDVMGFATVANPYPCNAAFAFDEHSRTSLIHSPDPQVAPGRKRFGWGHGDISTGVPAPTDVTGLALGRAPAEGVRIDLVVPETVFRGEFVTATVTVTNESDVPRRISSAINLAEGDLRLLVTPPAGVPADVRDVILACGDRTYLELQPGESVSRAMQIFYTSVGHTFRYLGRYFVSAELDLGDGDVARSAPMEVVVRAPMTEEEQEISRLTMDPAVGASLALGDFGVDEAAREKVATLARRFAETSDTGAAAALLLANSTARTLRNLRTGEVARRANPQAAEEAVGRAVSRRAPESVMHLALAVVAPIDRNAPVLQQTMDQIRQAPADTAAEPAVERAQRMRDDFGRTIARTSAPAPRSPGRRRRQG
jgi:hypothetical protein